MSRFVSIALFLVSACASASPEAPRGDLYITNVAVIDARDGVIQRGGVIQVRGDEIIAVSRGRAPEGATIIDGGGAYAIPGLWDMHAHVLSDPDDAVWRALPLFIAHGVTGVRDMGSPLPGIEQTRGRIADDVNSVAPRLYVSGPLLDGVRLPWYGDLPLVLRTAADVERELPRLRAAGVDFLKVYDQLPRSAYDAVVEWGHANGLPVAGHVPNAVGLHGTAEAEQRTIEHLALPTLGECATDRHAWFQRWIDAKFGEGADAYYRVTLAFFDAADLARCDFAFRSLAEHNVYLTPTLTMELNDSNRIDRAALAFMPQQSREWCETHLGRIDRADRQLRERAFATYGVALARMRAAGIVVLAGTDSPNNCIVAGASLHWELRLLQQSGLTPLEALQAATTNAAAAMERDDLGRIAPGYRADIVLLRANPLEDIANTTSIDGVMARGRWFGADALAHMRARAEAQAAQQPAP